MRWDRKMKAFALGALALIPMLISGKFRRWQGFVMLSLYSAYIILMFIGVIPIG